MSTGSAAPTKVGSVLQRVTRMLSRAGVLEARRDAELLLGKAISRPRTFLLSHPEAPVSSRQLTWLARAVNQRRRHYPLQYLLGEQEFYGRSFQVSPAVLIPRPETEVVVAQTLKAAAGLGQADLLGLDLGTGSGCIAITLVQEEPRLKAVAVDYTRAALRVAAANARRLGAQARISFLQADLFSGLSPARRFHLIVSNPPYVSPEKWKEVDYSVRSYEPATAVFAHPDGLSFYRRILEQAPGHLAPGGRLLLELGYDVEAEVASLAVARDWIICQKTHDLAGIIRCVELCRRRH